MQVACARDLISNILHEGANVALTSPGEYKHRMIYSSASFLTTCTCLHVSLSFLFAAIEPSSAMEKSWLAMNQQPKNNSVKSGKAGDTVDETGGLVKTGAASGAGPPGLKSNKLSLVAPAPLSRESSKKGGGLSPPGGEKLLTELVQITTQFIVPVLQAHPEMLSKVGQATIVTIQLVPTTPSDALEVVSPRPAVDDEDDSGLSRTTPTHVIIVQAKTAQDLENGCYATKQLLAYLCTQATGQPSK